MASQAAFAWIAHVLVHTSLWKMLIGCPSRGSHCTLNEADRWEFSSVGRSHILSRTSRATVVPCPRRTGREQQQDVSMFGYYGIQS